MGILNITSDSVSDGGRFLDQDAALQHARCLIDEGADIIDIGGESTRPGAETVSTQEEMDRVMPVLDELLREFDVSVSLDTSKAELMTEGTRLGASMINDVRALQEPGALEAAVTAAMDFGCEVCIMHMQGEPATMQNSPSYNDVVEQVCDFLAERAGQCVKAGIPPAKLLTDPGFGFGKTTEHNLLLLKNLHRVCELGFAVLAGLSRKRMFGEILANSESGEPFEGNRIHASVAAGQIAAANGAAVLRVHDVAAHVHAMKVMEAVATV